MIIEERINTKCVKTYSSEDKNIKQVEGNIVMRTAIDAYPNPYTYIEVDEDIPDSEPTDEERLDAYEILMGLKE